MGIPKIISATSLRSELYETLKDVANGESHIITHKQGGPVFLVSKNEFDKILDEKELLKRMTIGLSQIESGEGISHKMALQKLKVLKKKWK